jgi:isopentenyl diphosphate isomerase/L-lactate dehydrogenase-like FMN-dependent dehydrogenase
VAAGGEIGVKRALGILAEEVDMTLALIGCPTIAELGPDFLFAPHSLDSNRATGSQ